MKHRGHRRWVYFWIYKSAISGEFINKAYYRRHPTTTYKALVKRPYRKL